MKDQLLAQITNPALGPNLQTYNNNGSGFVATLVSVAITIIFIVGITLFFFMFLMGGISWISSGGDKAQLESSRGRITSALLGLFILFIIFAIIRVIEGVFNLNLLQLTIPTLPAAGS